MLNQQSINEHVTELKHLFKTCISCDGLLWDGLLYDKLVIDNVDKETIKKLFQMKC